jgi:hypothetical protein
MGQGTYQRSSLGRIQGVTTFGSANLFQGRQIFKATLGNGEGVGSRFQSLMGKLTLGAGGYIT